MGYKVRNIFSNGNTMVLNEILNNQYSIGRVSLDLFLEDKVFKENNRYIVVTEGVLLNSKELKREYCVDSLFECIVEMYHKKGDAFFDDFRGAFSGAFYDKQRSVWLIWTSAFAEVPIFYLFHSDRFVVSTDLLLILDFCKKNKLFLSLNNQAVISMITYGFMYGDFTYAKEINKLKAGSYLKFDEKKLTVNKYFELTKFKYDLSNLSESELIKELDIRFRTAINLEFLKDEEYKYKHLVDLSGGFDTRMVNFVSKEMGYNNIKNIHYSKSLSLESRVSQIVARKLKNRYFSYNLDDLEFMKDIDSIVSMNYGLGFYLGLTGGKTILEGVVCKDYGLEHTGLLGDVVVGSYIKESDLIHKQKIGGLYSTKYIHLLNKDEIDIFTDLELQKMYIRGFNGMLSSIFLRRYYTEVSSPFIFRDFLEFCFSIPLNLRQDHYLYNKWVRSRYINASKIMWATTGGKIGESKIVSLIRKVIQSGPKKILRLLGFSRFQSSFGMNPLDYWRLNNKDIDEFMNTYFSEGINHPLIESKYKEIMSKLFLEGNTIEKSQVLTVLSSLKLYFGLSNYD